MSCECLACGAPSGHVETLVAVGAIRRIRGRRACAWLLLHAPKGPRASSGLGRMPVAGGLARVAGHGLSVFV